MAAASKEWPIIIEKNSPILLNPEGIAKEFGRFKHIVEKNEQRGFRAMIPRKFEEPQKEDNSYHYCYHLTIVKDRIHKIEAVERNFHLTFEMLKRKAEENNWVIYNPNTLEQDEDGELVVPTTKRDIFQQDLDFQLPELTEEVLSTYFSRLYSRESHIRIIYKAIETAVRTKFIKRRHCILYGSAGCAKSEVLQCFKNWLNQACNKEIIWELQSPTSSKSGTETILLEKSKDGTLPPILILEELEKFNMQIMLGLLSVLDSRGVIARNNARIGNVSASCRLLCFGTCNDLIKLKNFEGSALFSRFSHKIYFSRPNKELMEKILYREAKEMEIPLEYHEKTIKEIIKYGFDELMDTDPRMFASLLDGYKDIDGYLNDLRKINELERLDNQMEARSALKQADNMFDLD